MRIKYFTKQTNLAGFSLVELLVVISTIGILATITIVGYGSWQKSITTSQLQSDLNGAATAMEDYRNFNDVYPSTLPTTFKPSDKVNLVVTGGGSLYCIDATSTKDASLKYYIDSTRSTGGAKAGTCATR